MKEFIYSILILGLLSACVHRSPRDPQSEMPGNAMVLEKIKIGNLPEHFRVGYLREASHVRFRGCILYLEGLADSVLNHRPYFQALSQAGYRVLFFDYLGQGGSEGEMKDTRVNASAPPYADKIEQEIAFQANAVWARYSLKRDSENERTCAASPKMVIGWSTGGLAGYRMAYQKWANAVVLITPGIVTKAFVGESVNDGFLMVQGKPVISERTLTRQTFAEGTNPHIDPIKPDTPMSAFAFSSNLLATSLVSRTWKIPTTVQGLVLLSSRDDTYVNSEETQKVLQRNAPHFSVVSYPGALHELDNEIPEVAADVRAKTIEFFNRVTE